MTCLVGHHFHSPPGRALIPVTRLPARSSRPSPRPPGHRLSQPNGSADVVACPGSGQQLRWTQGNSAWRSEPHDISSGNRLAAIRAVAEPVPVPSFRPSDAAASRASRRLAGYSSSLSLQRSVFVDLGEVVVCRPGWALTSRMPVEPDASPFSIAERCTLPRPGGTAGRHP